ncbi:hypothetical protein NF699_09660 [Sphingomonadaceae bacterium OTU29LAMAA1]|nr:hypothetical protein NF699_09660 [Sphingomonadaceae bacterium OTU29LAMAA1]
MAQRVPTTDEVRGVLASVLAGATDGKVSGWHAKVGPVVRLPCDPLALFNWDVMPVCDEVEKLAVAEAVKLVRAKHPFVAE